MKQALISFLFLLLSVNVFAQDSVSYTITGYIKNAGNSKFAYLHFSKNTEKTKRYLYTPIVNQQFVFKGKEALDSSLYASAQLLLSDTLMAEKSIDRLAKSQEFWRERNFRLISLEDDITVEIEDKNSLRQAIVVGGDLNKAADAVREAIRTRSAGEFFKTHTDSPISLEFLSSIETLPAQVRESLYASLDLEQIFSTFSERLKNSKRGKQLLAKLIKARQ